jgi:NlpC/P60 family
MPFRHLRDISRQLLVALALVMGVLGVPAVLVGSLAEPASAATNQGQAIVNAAAAEAGIPYCYDGGNTGGPTHGSGGSGCGGNTVGFDCSGLALYAVYQATGIVLPHGQGMASAPGGQVISNQSDLQPGDLVFFGGGSLANFVHVGIYAGNGMMWDANDYNVPVQQHSLTWEENALPFDGGVRYWTASSGTGSYADGTFVKGNTSNTVYIMAGGAPMAITTWSYWGGSHPITVIPQADMNALLLAHPYPADGTFIKKGGTNAVLEVIGGSYLDVSSWASWGKSQLVVTVDPWAIANQLLQTPRDGTFIKVGTSNAIMEIVGDSALDVSSWSPFGGAQPFTMVDPWAVQHDLLKYPKDGTFIKAGGTNSILEVAGGSALPVSSWASVGGGHPCTVVDPWAISNDLRQYPLDGTYVKNAIGNSVYIVAGGAALDVSSWSAVGGPHNVVDVDQWAIDNDLRSYPADGTLILGYGSGREYLIENQTAIYQTPTAGSPTVVDDWAIINQLGVSDG